MQLSPNLDKINKSISRIATDVTAKDMLLQFDRVLEESGIYAYANWFEGELIEGPDISRYWFTTTWMWPEACMPDPDAGLRLTKKGCRVYFYKDTFVTPAKIKGPESFEDTIHRKAREDKHSVWCVKIEMPRRLIDDDIMDIIDLEDVISVDTSISDNAYDTESVNQENTEELDDFDSINDEEL
jgi:hypothetical protein